MSRYIPKFQLASCLFAILFAASLVGIPELCSVFGGSTVYAQNELPAPAKKKNTKKKKKKKTKKKKKKSKKKKKKNNTSSDLFSAVFSGGGDVSLQEDFSSQNTSFQCRKDKTSNTEKADLVQWQAVWRDVNPKLSESVSAAFSTFSASYTSQTVVSADLSSCNTGLNNCKAGEPNCELLNMSCTDATLDLVPGVEPLMIVSDAGNFILISLVAEVSVEVGTENANGDCSNTSLFDNPALIDANRSITATTYKLTKIAKSKTSTVPALFSATLDCTDSSRVGSNGISNVCTVTSRLNGSLELSGPYEVEQFMAQ